ncbi:unnamed protein product [Phytophthora lilii]|uniref:Lipoamide acyltransferase component of branched-chain alpha-keto acid dehydrogenase complex, mitochondrial n=1 Tax=Phytophthora lilii TaxID=2077276 RepID=A0A9W6TDZ6_9STRA|nr:unnamed protein product [Phytophthora lilii]
MTLPVQDDALFLGLDCSTQSMSAVVVDARGQVVYESSFRFDERFPQYGTDNGVLRTGENEVVIPSLMFVESLDAIMEDLAKSAVDVAKIKSVSGSAQQHASVYWSKGFSLCASLDAAAEVATSLVEAMKKQEQSAFYLPNGPSWMDSSTTRYCSELQAAVGGADRVAEISGSRAYERFTGNQIAKRIHEDPAFLEKCGRIALVSSMLTSLLCGDYTPIDDSDGSGMNLLDVRERVWSPELVKATAKYSSSANAPDKLKEALGSQVTRAYSSVGAIHAYFQKKYGFAADCKVIPFSGDNPCTLAGIGLSQPGDVGVSLGTSSTLFAVVPTEAARFSGKEGHFFCNPIDPNTIMAMICFKNGSLTRQEVRDRRAGASWEKFEELMQTSKAGNGGTTAFYYQDPEITPSTLKADVVGFDASGARTDITLAPPEVEVRAVVESQFLSLRLHAEKLGVNKPQRLIVVGGASANKCMLQVLANVFNTPVYRLTCASNSAALGGAFRARHGYACSTSSSGFVSFDVGDSLDFSLSATPIDDDAKTGKTSCRQTIVIAINTKRNHRQLMQVKHVAPPGQISARRNQTALIAADVTPAGATIRGTATSAASSGFPFPNWSSEAQEIPFKLADIGEGIAEVEVLQWFVKSGDAVKQFQNVCEVQSDKATVEITSRYDGVVTKVHYEVGDMAKVGSTLIDIDVDEATAAAAQGAGKKKAAGPPVPRKAPTPVAPEPVAALVAAAPAPTPVTTPTPITTRIPIAPRRLDGGEKLLTSPSVRRLAKEHSIDLHDVEGTGPEGRILKGDLLEYIKLLVAQPQKASTPAGQTAAAAPPPAVDGSNATYLQQDTVVPLTPIQKMMVKSMNAALKIPHFGYADEIRMDALYDLRKELKPLAEARGVKLSFMPFIIKAASLALKQYPMLNATVNESETELTLVASHNISVAMDTPTGLIVPNVKNVQLKSIMEIAEDLNRLQQLAVAGKLAPGDLTGGTFSIGGTYMSPVLMVPQVAIGAIGQIQKLPRYDAVGNVEPVRLMNVSWSGDHRVIDGATMARFSNQWKEYLETPVSMLTEMS